MANLDRSDIYKSLNIKGLRVNGDDLFAARNVGQTLTVDAAIFYVLNLGKKEKKDKNNNQTK